MSQAGSPVMEGGDKIKPPYPEPSELLLSTKLFVPQLRPDSVSRPRLIAQLESCPGKVLTLISAPAGYGKTTLVSSWLQGSTMPSSWLSLDEGDNDLTRFLQNFLTALQKIVPTIQPDLINLVQKTKAVPYELLLNILINEIVTYDTQFVVILDDFHVIHDENILKMLAYLIDHAPPKLHLLILTRIDPPLPLFRLRARDQLMEIRAEQLRFTNQETTIFMSDVMGLKLSADDINAMRSRTEGWIAGLQLAALSMQSCKDIHSFISDFAGSHHHIMDYLTEEVLKSQTEQIHAFILQTSILTSMCAALCDAVTKPGDTDHSDGQTMLETLEAMNLFVNPLDEKREWYRYHPLFADVVKIRLRNQYPEQISELHSRASEWYEQNAMISEAIQHTIIAGNQAHAAQLVIQNGCSLLMSGESFTLLKWVDSVTPYTQTHPWLSILKAWGHALTGSLDQVEPTLRLAEGLFSPLEPTIEVKIMLGSIAAARAHVANLHGHAELAEGYAHGALEYLPVSNDFSCSMRSVATSIQGDASWINGNLLEARNAYQEAAQISQATGNSYMGIIAKSNLADVCFDQGELKQAARIYTETLKEARRPDGQALPLADHLHAGLGAIAYEWNRLDDAEQHTRQSIELCKQWGNSHMLVKSYVILAWLEQARANLKSAQEAMHCAELMLDEQQLTPKRSEQVKLDLARMGIRMGNLERAEEMVMRLGITIEDEIKQARMPEYLLLLRLLLAQGKYDAARYLASRLLNEAEAARRKRLVIEISILQALICQGIKDLSQALAVLGRALSLAQPEGYVRTFLDEGKAMTKLLIHLRSQQSEFSYASDLIAAQAEATGVEQPLTQHLVEPLTMRELDVLSLIEAGCTNQDIANRLVISIPTVKRHISNIYAKLEVKTRTQAVSLGRELGLLE